MTKRRFSSRFQRSPIPSLKLIYFECGGEYYAINISQVEHILPEFTLHGCLDNGRSLVKYKDQAIAVLDLTKLFSNPQDKIEHQGCVSCEYLIICTLKPSPNSPNIDNKHHSPSGDRLERFGIPTMAMPTILEIAETQLEDLPELYLQGTPGSSYAPKAIEKLIHTTDGKTIFYLNLEKFTLNSYD
jgi:chemotaxis signal transduction protein